MFNFPEVLHPVTLALISTLFFWLASLFGAFVVFFPGNIERKFNDGMPGLAEEIIIDIIFKKTIYRLLAKK